MIAEPTLLATAPPGLNLAPSEQMLAVADMTRRLMTELMPPAEVTRLDETQEFPRGILHTLGQNGLMGIIVPETYGGSGMGYHEYVTALTEIGRVCGALCLSVAAHNSLCVGHILYYGSEAQKQQYLPKLATGQHLGAWGLTEPNTGSDAGNMRTTATRQGDHWVLNGAKNFITHGISADTYVIVARTGEPRARANATAFILERGMKGLRGGKKENKLGMRCSETAEVLLDNVQVPDANRLGEVGSGFHQAMGVLDGGRISIAAVSLGVATGALHCALKYAQEREQFGKPIAQFQAIQFKLAQLATELEAATLLTQRAAYLKNTHQPVSMASAMAKLFASELSVRAGLEAIQIMGGYGYVKDYPAEKFLRDAKLLTIGEGTTEIQQLVIARELLRQ